MARFIHIENGRNPDSMRRDDVILFREDTRSAPFMTNTATQSDFPGILGGAILNTASALYDLAPPSLKTIAARRDRKNFQSGFATRLARPVLTEVKEGGEIQSTPLYERKESAQLRTYAWMISLGRMMLIADDHNQIRDAVRGAIDAAIYCEDDRLFELLSANTFAGVTLADGVALFHTNHANTGTGVIAAAGLAAGFEALLDQRDANSAHFLNTNPRYLVCGPKNIVTAKMQLQLLAYDNDIQVIVEPRLADTTNWYLAADPAACAGLEYGGLVSSPRPRLQMAPAFQVDGLQFKIVHDTGAWVADWRPLYRSTGA